MAHEALAFMFADFIDGANARMIQSGAARASRRNLAAPGITFGQIIRKKFERNEAAELGVLGLVNVPIATPPTFQDRSEKRSSQLGIGSPCLSHILIAAKKCKSTNAAAARARRKIKGRFVAGPLIPKTKLLGLRERGRSGERLARSVTVGHLEDLQQMRLRRSCSSLRAAVAVSDKCRTHFIE